MPIEIGTIEAIFRYPVKSMRGESLAAATLGWHGLDGDRRLAFRRLDGQSDFPWLTASNVPELILFTPQWAQNGNGETLPTHVLTPEGKRMPIFEEPLAAEIGRHYGHRVEMMQLKHGYLRRCQHLGDHVRYRSRDRPTRREERRRPTISSEHRGPLHAGGSLRGG